MAELKTKNRVLTPADLARYGIPPKQRATNDPDAKVLGEAETDAANVHEWIGRAVGE
jgi:hypothetical protein